MTKQSHEQARHHAERRVDTQGNDSFPASDPPSHSGITGIRGKTAPGGKREEHRPPPDQRGDELRPTGHPNSDRHAAETVHHWEDEKPVR